MSHWPIYCFSTLTASNQGFLPFLSTRKLSNSNLCSVFFFKLFLLFVPVSLHRLSSSFGERGLFLVEVCGLLTVVASLVAEQGLWAHSSCSTGFSSLSARALEHRLSSCGTPA